MNALRKTAAPLQQVSMCFCWQHYLAATFILQLQGTEKLLSYRDFYKHSRDQTKEEKNPVLGSHISKKPEAGRAGRETPLAVYLGHRTR